MHVTCKPSIDKIIAMSKFKRLEKHYQMLAIQTDYKGAN